MGHSYEVSKKVALKTIIILAVITVIEVLIALTGKGYIIKGFHIWPWLMNLSMISLSLYKAYLIVGEFMHMRHEVKSLAMTVLLPTLLLVWGIIAFMYEGDAWKNNRNVVKEKDERTAEDLAQPQGMLLDPETKILE